MNHTQGTALEYMYVTVITDLTPPVLLVDAETLVLLKQRLKNVCTVTGWQRCDLFLVYKQATQ